MPKTLLIYQDDFDFKPEFIVLDGDYSRFNGVVINADSNPELEQELLELLYGHNGTGERQHKGTTEFPLEQQPFTYVAVCGSYP